MELWWSGGDGRDFQPVVKTGLIRILQGWHETFGLLLCRRGCLQGYKVCRRLAKAAGDKVL